MVRLDLQARLPLTTIVCEQLLDRPASSLLRVVPLATIIGQLELSGDALKRQLTLGHSGYMMIRPDLGFIGFAGLHYMNPDGHSARYYWDFMQTDITVLFPLYSVISRTKNAGLAVCSSMVLLLVAERRATTRMGLLDKALVVQSAPRRRLWW